MDDSKWGGTTVQSLIESLEHFPSDYKVVFNVLSEGIICDLGHIEADYPRQTVFILQDY